MYRNYTLTRGERNRVDVTQFEADAEVDGRTYELNPRLDLANHSPSGFEWGYGGSGPSQTALAILADWFSDRSKITEAVSRYAATLVAFPDMTPGDRLALYLHEQFKADVIAPLRQHQVKILIDQTMIEAWLETALSR